MHSYAFDSRHFCSVVYSPFLLKKENFQWKLISLCRFSHFWESSRKMENCSVSKMCMPAERIKMLAAMYFKLFFFHWEKENFLCAERKTLRKMFSRSSAALRLGRASRQSGDSCTLQNVPPLLGIARWYEFSTTSQALSERFHFKPEPAQNSEIILLNYTRRFYGNSIFALGVQT